MPRAAQKRPKFEPDQLVIAWETFSTVDGLVVRQGTRLRGDDPAVQAAPHLFLPVDANDREIQRRAEEEFAAALEANRRPPPAPPRGARAIRSPRS